MTGESIPAVCQECPQAGQNLYTKSWYCVNSGAPLGSKRAWDYCTSPKRAERVASNAGSTTSQPAAPEAGMAAGSATGQTDESEAGAAANPGPEVSREAPGPGTVSQQQEAADGDIIPDQVLGCPPREEELAYGYPFDFM